MSIEKGACQTMLKTDLPLFLARYLIPNKFRHTIGKALTKAIIGDNLKFDKRTVNLNQILIGNRGLYFKEKH
jgi:hypothetical protein